MKSIEAPIKLHDRGEAVVNLQGALLFLLEKDRLRLSDDERRELLIDREAQVYRDGTSRAVMAFREQFQLKPSGIVDKLTANALNKALSTTIPEVRSFETPPIGTAPRLLSLNSRGEDVRALQQALLKAGFALPEQERQEQLFGVGTREAVLTLQARYGLRNTGVFDEATRHALSNALNMASDRKYRVEGRILFDHGLPADGVPIRLYHRRFGDADDSPKFLRKTKTDDQGFYSISYNMNGGTANLEVRAVDAHGKGVPLSATKFNAGKHEVLNLVVPASVRKQPAEYHRLTNDLAKQIGAKGRLGAAREERDEKRRDLTLLHHATGWDARLIALAAIAERLSTESDIPREAVYGLLRAGLPSDKLFLAEVAADVAERALQKVRDSGIVALNDQQIGKFKQQFVTFAKKTRLATPAPGSRSTYGELLKASGLSADAQAKFAPVYLNHRSDAAQLWKNARQAGLDEVQVGKLQLQGKLAFLAGNSEAMTTRLMQRQINDPVELVRHEFYKADQWKAEVKALTGNDEQKLNALIPPAYEADQVEHRLSAYAEDMARKVRLSYPTQVVGHIIEQDILDPFTLGATRANTAKLLQNAAAQGFRLGEIPVESFFKAHPNARDDLTDKEFKAAQQEMKTLQRVYQITPSNEAMPVLLKLGLKSAYDVVALPEQVFIERFAKELPSLEQARLVYRKAQQVSSVTHNLVTIAQKWNSDLPVSVISASAEVRDSVRNELIKHYPTMESLFGSMDFCECEHCRSVLSPAAYLVDLLREFIDAEEEVWRNFLADWKEKHNNQEYTAQFKKPYDALIERRPDLPHIQLTCDNTNIALPYIDIVNEILEYYVANDQLTKDAAHDTGEATTAELLAEPQNVIAEAYNKLRTAPYPLTLPFDLWLETVRRFCEYFENPLWRVLEVFRPSNELFAPDANPQPYYRENIFLESLGLSSAEAAIFTDSEPLKLGKWHELFGYPSAEIDSPTNIANATTKVPNAAADLFNVGNKCKYYDAATEALQNEEKEISAIGAKDSGGQGKATITFVGIWTIPPKFGDKLVLANVLELLTSAKSLCRRLGVTYMEIAEIVQTGFVNPKLTKLSVLYKLGVSIHDARFYLDHKGLLLQDPTTLSTEAQKWRLEVEAFSQELGKLAVTFNVPTAQLEAELQAIPFDEVLELYDPNADCNFDLTTLQYADGTPAKNIDLLKINLLVRLWRKLGWTIEETDRALQTFVPQNTPFDADVVHLEQQPLKTALIYLAHLRALDEQVQVGKQSRLKLLTLWSDIATTGKNPLYAQLFLIRNVLKSDPVFDHPLGKYLQYFDAVDRTYKPFYWDPDPPQPEDPATGNISLKSHLLAVQGALTVTSEEIGRILADAKGNPFEDAAEILNKEPLNLVTVSVIYRYGLLAKALKLSVHELIALKQLSGLDPFTQLHPQPPADTPVGVEPAKKAIDFDYPFSQTLRFVEVLEEVKESGLTIEDLDYLLRHRDDTGKYRPNRERTLALLKTLAEGVRAIRTEHGVPDGPGTMTDEVLRQKLGAALPPDVLERFLAMMNGTAEFTATKAVEASSSPLEPQGFADEPAIREVRYSAMRQEQKLTFRGVLFDAEKKALMARLPKPVPPNQHVESPLLGKLLDDVQQQARSFFDDNLKKQTLRLDDEAGFLDEDDFDSLFGPLEVLQKIKPDDSPEDVENKLKENAKIEQRNREKLQQRYYDVASNFSSYLQKRLTGQFIVQTLTAQTGADPMLVEGLVTDFRLLGQIQPPGATHPLLEAFTATADRGITGAYFFSANQTGVKLTTRQWANDALGRAGTASNPVRSIGFNRAELDGYLEVPRDNDYDFSVVLAKKGDKALLHIGDQAKLLLQKEATQDGEEISATQVHLEKGKRYLIRLLLEGIRASEAKLKVKSASQPKDTYNSSRLEGYLEVPAHGAYRFYVELEKQNAVAELRFDHLPQPLFLSGAAPTNNAVLGDKPNEYLELRPGTPYHFSLDLRSLNGGEARVLVQGETLPKDRLTQLTLYPATVVERAECAEMLLTKVLQLVKSLGLSEREIRYMVTYGLFFVSVKQDFAHELDKREVSASLREEFQSHARTLTPEALVLVIEPGHSWTIVDANQKYVIRNKNHALNVYECLSLSTLPTATSDDTPDGAKALFGQFLRLARYARLKRDLAGGMDDLIGIFEANGTGNLNKVYSLIAKLTRRDKTTVEASAKALFGDKPDFDSEKPLQRLWEALQVVERFGVPVASLLEWTRIVSPTANPKQPFAIARDLRNALKARFEPETWQRVVQPIFDKLRQRQRDALVAHVMHQHGFDRVEQLYEHFLIDPGMEPVVQTSRVRLAISSVQTFVQRCLLNLEPQVHPSAIINAKHWEWMKRYRVWEANRKIFLFPENWLEPEFRDDKSHLFTELEGALLQGDVSEDLVEDAFLNYLNKLDELARLDILAMHLDDKGDPNTLHVFGRTFSQPYKYFYRRYADHMWTPWEPVSVDIEGEHLAPVIWRDRLYLFWVTFMEKPADPVSSQTSGDGALSGLTLSELTSSLIASGGKRKVEARLHWSEYLHGEWSTHESSGLAHESTSTIGPLPFYPRDEVFIHVFKAYEKDEERGVHVILKGPNYLYKSFHLVGRNSAVEEGEILEYFDFPYVISSSHATRYAASGKLIVKIPGFLFDELKIILEDGGKSYILVPCNNASVLDLNHPPPPIDAQIRPFFYQDKSDMNTFFIQPEVSARTIEEWQDWVTRTAQPDPGWQIPDWWKEIVVVPQIPSKGLITDPGDPQRLAPIDPVSIFKLKPGHDWLVNPATGLLFGDALIGPGGRTGLEIQPLTKVAGVIKEDSKPVNVHAGSALAANDAIVLTGATALEKTGLMQVAGGLHVVGSAGFNSALAQNFDTLNR